MYLANELIIVMLVTYYYHYHWYCYCHYVIILIIVTIIMNILVLIIFFDIVIAIVAVIITIIDVCLMILQVDLADNVASGHCYKDKAGHEGAAPRSRQARVGKELAGMAADLPLNVSSSVFLRVDEKQMMLWKALITGTNCKTHRDA